MAQSTEMFALPSDKFRIVKLKLHRLEAVRGFAAAYVVLHHALPHSIPLPVLNVGFLLRFGQEAVILFFLLSGFVIHYSFARRPIPTSEFFLNRITRIFVPLLPVMLLSYAVSSFAAGRLIDIDLATLFGNILMLQDISSLKPGVIVDPYMGNSPLWSLSYEWWFYAIYIWLIKTFPSISTRTNVVIILAASCAMVYYWHPMWPLRVGIYLSIWWCGVLMADRYIVNDCRSVPASSLIVVLLPLLIATTILLLSAWHSGALNSSMRVGTHPVLEIRHLTAAVVFVVAAYIWQSFNWRWFYLIFLPFAVLAPISYGIYISHSLLLKIPELLGINPLSVVALIGSFTAVVIFSSFLELWFYPRAGELLRKCVLSSKLGA